jgi:hypothetical protein
MFLFVQIGKRGKRGANGRLGVRLHYPTPLAGEDFITQFHEFQSDFFFGQRRRAYVDPARP